MTLLETCAAAPALSLLFFSRCSRSAIRNHRLSNPKDLARWILQEQRPDLNQI
jgi:hypothetical protein